MEFVQCLRFTSTGLSRWFIEAETVKYLNEPNTVAGRLTAVHRADTPNGTYQIWFRSMNGCGNVNVIYNSLNNLVKELTRKSTAYYAEILIVKFNGTPLAPVSFTRDDPFLRALSEVHSPALKEWLAMPTEGYLAHGDATAD